MGGRRHPRKRLQIQGSLGLGLNKLGLGLGLGRRPHASDVGALADVRLLGQLGQLGQLSTVQTTVPSDGSGWLCEDDPAVRAMMSEILFSTTPNPVPPQFCFGRSVINGRGPNLDVYSPSRRPMSSSRYCCCRSSSYAPPPLLLLRSPSSPPRGPLLRDFPMLRCSSIGFPTLGARYQKTHLRTLFPRRPTEFRTSLR